MIDDLLNSTKNISIHTVTARLLQEHQISAAFLITTGIAILFFGHSVWSFSRKNILVPLVICVLVLLFRPDFKYRNFLNMFLVFKKMLAHGSTMRLKSVG
jgi:membrane protein YdbS with pleckstrin-like domain